MNILITGASGFVGSHLIEFYSKYKKGNKLFCLTYKGSGWLQKHIKKIQLIELDLLQTKKVEIVVEKTQPEVVFHLAAMAAVGQSYQEPQKVIKNNILSTVNLLESLKKYQKKAKILLIGSADEYGVVEENHSLVGEETSLRPTSPYAVSKVATDYLGLQYFLAYGMPIIRVRPFNHIGERQGLGFAVSDFAKRIAEAEISGIDKIRVGNLSAIRDFTDVKDVVEAYNLAIEKCIPGEVYNIGSGRGVRIQDLLNILISKSTKEIQVEIDPKLYRPVDVESVVADSSKFKNLTGWKPKIPLEVTLERVLNYWRKKLKEENGKKS